MSKFGGFGGGMGGMGNMQQMLKQAQKMQEDLKQAQEDLEAMDIEGSSGGGLVTVTVNGKSKFIGVKIDPKAVDPDDIEMLEDLILSAFNNAAQKAAEEYNERIPQGLGI